MHWQIDLPSYWIKQASEIEGAWRPTGEPSLGNAWYCPFHGDAERIKRNLEMLWQLNGPQYAAGIERLKCDFATRHNLPCKGNDTIYPLKFSVRQR